MRLEIELPVSKEFLERLEKDPEGVGREIWQEVFESFGRYFDEKLRQEQAALKARPKPRGLVRWGQRDDD